MADTRIFLTSGSSWTVPADCQSATIECIGGGGKGSTKNSGLGFAVSGGGGGAYSKKNSLSLTPGDSISYQVGGQGQDTWFKSTSDVLAKGGTSCSDDDYTQGALGGQASSGVGDTKYSGGNGVTSSVGWLVGGGGGGAGGIYANGNNGRSDNGTGGQGDGTYGGAGGTFQSNHKDGYPGQEFDTTHGSGGGGGGGEQSDSRGYGGNGGLYGGGGGGAGNAVSLTLQGGSGAQGLIVITYTPVIPGTSKFFQLF